MSYVYPEVMGAPITREEIMECLRQGYTAILTLEKQKDSTIVGFPDMVRVLDHIEEHGLPPK